MKQHRTRIVEPLNPDDDADFADEHRDMTVGDDQRGGPEGISERESPRGYGGMDLRRFRDWWRRPRR